MDVAAPCDPTLVGLYDLYGAKTELYKVFPNPVMDVLTLALEAEAEIVRYEMLSLNGAIVSASSVDSLLIDIDTRHLGSGMYFLRVYDIDGQWKVEKVIKQ